MALTPRGFIDVQPDVQGGFDHADVHLESGRVFVAHTAGGTVELIDGQERRQLGTVDGSEKPVASCAHKTRASFSLPLDDGLPTVLGPGGEFIIGDFALAKGQPDPVFSRGWTSEVGLEG